MRKLSLEYGPAPGLIIWLGVVVLIYFFMLAPGCMGDNPTYRTYDMSIPGDLDMTATDIMSPPPDLMPAPCMVPGKNQCSPYTDMSSLCIRVNGSIGLCVC